MEPLNPQRKALKARAHHRLTFICGGTYGYVSLGRVTDGEAGGAGSVSPDSSGAGASAARRLTPIRHIPARTQPAVM
ncbi:hypothetical protein AAFF_G00020910 [Aldrovandia affinis]|uniref:Uncharacterized protein n=1 Tax=Aldrovandia affinis TaxID=143900 RepID=A0AAD7WHH7_9TELE|nr:hypothetical protein AAFF_G00020910 [Aldrovandia affinis]